MLLMRDRPDPLPPQRHCFHGKLLRSYQQEVFDSHHRYNICKWGRCTGKSFTVAAIAAHQVDIGNSVCVITCGEICTAPIRHILGTYYVINNNRLTLLSWDRDHSGPSVYSMIPNVIILDEYMYINSMVMNAVSPILTCSPDSKFYAFSTNSGTTDYLQQMSGWANCRVTSIPTSHPEVGIDLGPILNAIDPDTAQQEYMGY